MAWQLSSKCHEWDFGIELMNCSQAEPSKWRCQLDSAGTAQRLHKDGLDKVAFHPFQPEGSSAGAGGKRLGCVAAPGWYLGDNALCNLSDLRVTQPRLGLPLEFWLWYLHMAHSYKSSACGR